MKDGAWRYSMNKMLGLLNATTQKHKSLSFISKMLIDTEGVPVAWWHIDTVEGHDLLPALGVVVDPPRCRRRSGDDTIHLTPDMPGDNPRSSIVLHKCQVANLHSKR